MLCDQEAVNKSRCWQQSFQGELLLSLGALFLLSVGYLIPLHPRLRMGIFFLSYLLVGHKVLLLFVRDMMKGILFTNISLMTLATIGALALEKFTEAVVVMLFFMVGSWLENLSTERSRRSIEKLMDLRPPSANLLREGREIRIPLEQIKLNGILIVRPGEKIPTDGVVTEGMSQIDPSPLTGEFKSVSARPGRSVLGGTINISGVFLMRATALYENSAVARILKLLKEENKRKAKRETYIQHFARSYTPVVFSIALLISTLPPLLFGASFSTWFYQALIFLLASCPCALIISIPLAFFCGKGAASKKGVLLKGGAVIEEIAALKAIAFDKTGTLTQGTFQILKIFPANGVSERELLFWAKEAERFSNHPIALTFRKTFTDLPQARVTGYQELAGKGVVATVDGFPIKVGNRRWLQEGGISVPSFSIGGTLVYLASEKRYLGAIQIGDSLRPEVPSAIECLRKEGITEMIMVTGDRKREALAIAEKAAIDRTFYELLPHQKVSVVEKLKNQLPKGKKLAFVGDGINDAPVLTRADVGISMGEMGSDATIETSDVVLVTDNISRIGEIIRIARKTLLITHQNIFFSLFFKLIVITLGLFGMGRLWMAVAADLGITILAIFNSMRLLRGTFRIFRSRSGPQLQNKIASPR